jgi:predicted ATP-grasp superfamily ATP-dependent carboligase
VPRAALILDGGSGPALAFTRSLGKAGWRVVAPAGTRSAASRYAGDATQIREADADPRGFVADVAGVCSRGGIDVVVPCTDASVELLWAHQGVLGGARVVGADRASAERVLDKAAALAASDEAGFPTPRWEAPATRIEASRAITRIGFPCVLKPRRSYAALGGRLVHLRHRVVRRADDAERALSDLAELAEAPPVVEEFVPGRALAVTAVVRRGEVVTYVARETLTFEPIAGGTSVWKRTIAPDDVGVQAALDLLRAIGYDGLAEVEYQADGANVPRLMEIGVRAHGWVALAVAAGVDLPLVAANALVGDPLPELEHYRVGVEMRWPAGEVARLRTAMSPKASLPPGTRRRDVLAGTWPPWRPGMRYDGVVRDDLAPLLPRRLRRSGTKRRASQ